ncbi:hypothetical protein [Actinophytocola sp.]|uniref:hypothetical protein n=1 Tax=Actinophytocola sp. TaxID=1872138 RepID=UPI002ED60520
MDDLAEKTLADIRQLRARSRRLAHGGAWLPALLLAALVLVSMLLYRSPFGEPPAVPDFDTPDAGWWRHPFWAGLPAGSHSDVSAYLFWFVGLPLTVIVTGAWYRWRGSRLGMKIAWPWYAGVTCAVLALLAIIAAVPTRSVTPPFQAGWSGLLTPLVAVAVAAIALGVVERSLGLIVGGAWLGLIAGWNCALGVGELPGWLAWLLDGGDGSALGGQLTLFGLHRPGPVLILMTLPLLSVGLLGWWRARKVTR